MRLFRLLCILSVLMFVQAPAQTVAVGRIHEINGPAQVRRNNRTLRGMLLLPLHPGDLILIPRAGRVEVVFDSGARYALSGPSSAAVIGQRLERRSGLPPKELKAFRLPAARSGSRERILGDAVRPVGEDSPFNLTPDGGVREEPVTLRWSGPVEAHDLEVRVCSGKKAVLCRMLPASARRFEIPAGTLSPGEDYVWTVTGFSPDGTAGGKAAAFIRLLQPDEREMLRRLEQEVEGMRKAMPASTTPFLILARAYENLQMREEQRRAYQAALMVRPGDPGIREALESLDSASSFSRR